MATVTFYYDLGSQPCRAVYIFMKANNIPFKPVKIELLAAEHLQDDFKKVSPLQKVPVIDDDGFILTESASMFRYLANKYNVPEHWYPRADIQKQARVDEYLNYHHTSTRINVPMIFLHQFASTMRGRPVKEEEVKRFKAEFEKTVNHINTYFLKDNPFLCGDDISVADLQALCELHQLLGVGDEDLFQSNPRLKAWAERVNERVKPHLEEANQNGILMLKALYDKRLKDAKL